MDFRVSESCFDLNSHLAHGLWRLCRLILNWWHSQLYKSDHETAHPDFLCIIVHVLTSTERHLGISNKKMLWECSAKIEPVGSCKIRRPRRFRGSAPKEWVRYGFIFRSFHGRVSSSFQKAKFGSSSGGKSRSSGLDLGGCIIFCLWLHCIIFLFL